MDLCAAGFANGLFLSSPVALQHWKSRSKPGIVVSNDSKDLIEIPPSTTSVGAFSVLPDPVRRKRGGDMNRWSSCLAKTLPIGVLALIGLAFAASAAAQSRQPRFASLESFRGRASVVRLGSPLELRRGMALQRNDVVVTRDGTLVLRFYSDGSQLRVGANSRVQINESAGERDIEVFGGRLWARVVSWKERPVRFRSGSTIAAVRGTELAIDADGDTTVVSVLEGQVDTSNDEGSVTLGPGQSAAVEPGKAPAMQVVVRPQDSVQWALYFQPIIYALPADVGEDSSWKRAIRESMASYGQGKLDEALDLVGAVVDTEVDDSRFFAYRASLLLAASSVDKAAADIERSLELDPDDTQALALQAIIAVAHNENDKAIEVAEKAVAGDPSSATAQIALSYARQSVFDLPGAREALEKAVELDDDNALAWARLAELQLAFGRLGDALSAARTAATYDPNLNRTQTVLGYAYLTQVKTKKAIEAFERAIELDQGDPLPRLGLGLAKIRNGALDDGIQEIETAASLDPGNSLVRSYLGKAYFERKRKGLDNREYGLAKQLDPNDPTPWFYEAIAKQTTNRPVEALLDMEEAIDLNDNRGIYRSRLLLDSDLAARSASLGRIYGDLGFQNLALVEGWRSVNADPGNFSAHRLLADSYAALPRHEIARVSELYQSQMLQPLNTTAIQPRLAETSLFLISAQGPSALSFNEFNPLFNRDQVNAQVSGSYAEDQTWMGEAIVSGIAGKFSFSAGYSRYETDGWRENGDQENEIANVFVQLELSAKTSIQGEYRYRSDERGDVELRFFPDDYYPTENNTEERHTGRIGLRHDFSPGSTFLGSLIYQDAESSLVDDEDGPFVASLEAGRADDAYGGEVQYLYRSQYVNLTAGGGYFDTDGIISAKLEVQPHIIPPPDNIFEEIIGNDLQQSNVYAYSYINPSDKITLIVGASADILSGESPEIGDQDEFNPKLGITWNPTPGTTLRAAGFKTLARSLVMDQTLEPTNVAGFNQFYDDVIGTRATRYGGAIDQKISKTTFLGAEYSERDLEIPFLTLNEGTFLRVDAAEAFGRAYFFVAPHPMLALRAEYLYELLETDGAIGLPTHLDTRRLPLAISFFHPSGFSANVTGTYFDQEGEFIRISGLPESGSDTFWTLDASLSFRLPKRYGFLSIGATNLLDEEFSFYDIDTRNPTVLPTRRIYARLTLAF
jgi:tetratricopeptide (TPR) repeat protein